MKKIICVLRTAKRQKELSNRIKELQPHLRNALTTDIVAHEYSCLMVEYLENAILLGNDGDEVRTLLAYWSVAKEQRTKNKGE